MVAPLGPWHYAGRDRELKRFANQGLATVVGADGSTKLVYRGDWSIPGRLKDQGWVHVGDPGSSHGHLFDAYQGADGATSKMFEVTTPDGDNFEYVHPLEGDERM